MNFIRTELSDAFIIEPEKIEDGRGFFARCWDSEIFEENNLNSNLMQCNISFSKKKGTLRGMHYQAAPYQESKLVRCTKGSIFDVIIDMREDSNTFKKWIGVELSSDNRKMIFVPEGFAHGVLTLQDDTEIFYQVSQRYKPEYERIVRWDDPVFDIKWPIFPTSISEKDASAELFSKQ